MKYAVLSDIHAHNWSVFSSVDGRGVNTRLVHTLEEMKRAAKLLKAAGGNVMVIAGDIFHTRGTIDPEVLNPTRDAVREILEMGISIYAIPGNHDLKSKDTQELSSAIQNLQTEVDPPGMYGGFTIFNKCDVAWVPGHVLGFVPWRWTVEALLQDLENLAKHPEASQMDVFIHAGIDGVLSGMPAHGLMHTDLAKFGFRRVFAGHYHNHHDFGNGVYSIGATTHQTWGDVGTRAGFLLVDEKSVTFHDTMAPKFVDVSGLDEIEMELECKSNFVRFRGPAMTQEQINELRDQFRRWGALGVSIEVPRAVTAVRSAAPAKGMTLEQSIEAFIASADPHPKFKPEQITKRALEILEESRTVYEEA